MIKILSMLTASVLASVGFVGGSSVLENTPKPMYDLVWTNNDGMVVEKTESEKVLNINMVNPSTVEDIKYGFELQTSPKWGYRTLPIDPQYINLRFLASSPTNNESYLVDDVIPEIVFDNALGSSVVKFTKEQLLKLGEKPDIKYQLQLYVDKNIPQNEEYEIYTGGGLYINIYTVTAENSRPSLIIDSEPQNVRKKTLTFDKSKYATSQPAATVRVGWNDGYFGVDKNKIVNKCVDPKVYVMAGEGATPLAQQLSGVDMVKYITVNNTNPLYTEISFTDDFIERVNAWRGLGNQVNISCEKNPSSPFDNRIYENLLFNIETSFVGLTFQDPLNETNDWGNIPYGKDITLSLINEKSFEDLTYEFGTFTNYDYGNITGACEKILIDDDTSRNIIVKNVDNKHTVTLTAETQRKIGLGQHNLTIKCNTGWEYGSLYIDADGVKYKNTDENGNIIENNGPSAGKEFINLHLEIDNNGEGIFVKNLLDGLNEDGQQDENFDAGIEYVIDGENVIASVPLKANYENKGPKSLYSLPANTITNSLIVDNITEEIYYSSEESYSIGDWSLGNCVLDNNIFYCSKPNIDIVFVGAAKAFNKNKYDNTVSVGFHTIAHWEKGRLAGSSWGDVGSSGWINKTFTSDKPVVPVDPVDPVTPTIPVVPPVTPPAPVSPVTPPVVDNPVTVPPVVPETVKVPLKEGGEDFTPYITGVTLLMLGGIITLVVLRRKNKR